MWKKKSSTTLYYYYYRLVLRAVDLVIRYCHRLLPISANRSKTSKARSRQVPLSHTLVPFTPPHLSVVLPVSLLRERRFQSPLSYTRQYGQDRGALYRSRKHYPCHPSPRNTNVPFSTKRRHNNLEKRCTMADMPGTNQSRDCGAADGLPTVRPLTTEPSNRLSWREGSCC